jgi:mono/diheme cytochrome c family protein
MLLSASMIVVLLDGCGGGGETTSQAQTLVTGDVAAGRTLYDSYCASCHRCGTYDASGDQSDLAGKGAAVVTKLRYGHRESVHREPGITNTAAFVDSIAPLPGPVLTVAPAGLVTVAPYSSTRLDASVANSPVTAWVWTISGSTTVVAQTSYFVYQPRRTGTYTVKVTATVRDGVRLSKSVSFVVTTSAPPPPAPAPTTPTYTPSTCSGCHTGLQMLTPPVFHHSMLDPASVNPPFQPTLACGTAACHPADPAIQGNTLVIRDDCMFCHSGSHHGPAPMKCGTTVTGWQQTCAQCHGNEAYHQSSRVCTECHGNVHAIDSEHFAASACTVCHSTANVPTDMQTRCTTCHTSGAVGGTDYSHDSGYYSSYNDFAAPVVASLTCPPALERYHSGSFSATATDSDGGDGLTYSWTFTDPYGHTVGERSGPSTTYSFSNSGSNVARVVVTDRAGKTATAKCFVTVF